MQVLYQNPFGTLVKMIHKTKEITGSDFPVFEVGIYSRQTSLVNRKGVILHHDNACA